jgi:hypothetical protein
MSDPKKTEPPHRYSADRPLKQMSDDGLGRAPFAERLAADIFGWHGEDSCGTSSSFVSKIK